MRLKENNNSRQRRHINEYINYYDLDEPQILRDINTNEIYAIAFHQDNKRYIFSNEYGHLVIYNGGHSKKPMTKREYEEIRNQMINNVIKLNKEKRDIYLDEIITLDFSIGHANAVFEVHNHDYSDQTTISSLIINIDNMRYVYSPENNTVLKVNIDRTSPSGYITSKREKDEIIHKLTTSKTIRKKIDQITKKNN